MGIRPNRVLALAMLFILIISNLAFTEDIDRGALEVFLTELSKVSSETRKDAASILKLYFNDEDGIDNLINDIDIFISEAYIKIIESKGYTLDDVKDELNKLKSWTREEKSKLLGYLEDGNISGIRALIRQVDNKDTGSTGGKVSEDKKEEESKKDEPKEELIEVHFKDIENHRYQDDIIYLAQRGIIEGRTEEVYDPEGNLTRAEFMTLIYRVLKLESDIKVELPFKDVSKDSWYYEYVKAAFDNKIIEGTSPTTFSPNRYVTREEMVTVIIRILEIKGALHTIQPSGLDVAMYIDSKDISNWAKDFLFYGVKYGLIEGRTEVELAPREFASRGEAANTIKKLYDVLKNMKIEVSN